MAKPWEKYSSVPVSSKPWEKYGEMATVTPPAVSPIESGLRGAAQGATLGFSDEAAGGLDYLKQALSQVAKGGTLYDSDQLGSTYSKGRDESRVANEAAQAANPGTYLAGNLAGSLALPTGPVGLAKGAALGATQALGNSNSGTLTGLAADTALGAGIGGAVGGVGSLVGQGVSKLGDLAGDAVEGTSSLLKKGAGELADRATNSSMGREALDSGLIKLGDKAGDIAGRLGDDASPGLVQGLTDRIARERSESLFSGLDASAIGAAGLHSGPIGALGAAGGVVGKNLLNSRGASTGAVTLDKIGDILAQTPERLGKFARPLQDAQARGALNPTLFVLQQTNPEFRKLVYPEDH